MSSLTAHLRLLEDHSRLPFHPSCPVCRRDRLAGSLDGEELVSRRTQAAIAAGLLAFSGLGVPAAVASEPDSTSEGAAEVVDGGDLAVSPELDLELETAQLPDDATAPDPVDSATDEDSAPLEVEPAADVREPVVEVADNVPAPPAETGTGDPVPAEQPADATPPAEAAAPSTTEEPGITALATQPRKTLKSEARQERRPDRSIAEPAPVVPRVLAAEPEPPPAPPAPTAEPAPSSTVRVVARSSGSRTAPGDRFHVVLPGESLWSIAADLLGDRATVPGIAREVNRLWELNDGRIRTGDPDLLYAGTRLVVR
jgi:hypothetical protein